MRATRRRHRSSRSLRPWARPDGAVSVLIDDLGFGGTSAFGGPVRTPSFDRIAQEGVSSTNFHTQATCSPTRASMLSGRNHHAVNMGGIAEAGTAFPGNTTRIPLETASIAEILRLNGYSTAGFGKWHQTPPWETSASGPSTSGPPARALRSSMASLVFLPITGHQRSSMEPSASSRRRLPATIL